MDVQGMGAQFHEAWPPYGLDIRLLRTVQAGLPEGQRI